MHKDEKWQLYYPNGEPIPEKGWDSSLDNPQSGGDIVGVAVIFLYRLNSEGELEFLWQRRSENVSSYPGKYDFSAGGHINLGESLTEAAIREAREEIGAEVTSQDLKFVTTFGNGINRFRWMYVVDWTGKEDVFEFDDGEVSEVKWVPYVEMEGFRKKHAKEPLKNDDLTFAVLENWLKTQGVVKDGNI